MNANSIGSSGDAIEKIIALFHSKKPISYKIKSTSHNLPNPKKSGIFAINQIVVLIDIVYIGGCRESHS